VFVPESETTIAFFLSRLLSTEPTTYRFVGMVMWVHFLFIVWFQSACPCAHVFSNAIVRPLQHGTEKLHRLLRITDRPTSAG